jgi:hypothetical protein
MVVPTMTSVEPIETAARCAQSAADQQAHDALAIKGESLPELQAKKAALASRMQEETIAIAKLQQERTALAGAIKRNEDEARSHHDLSTKRFFGPHRAYSEMHAKCEALSREYVSRDRSALGNVETELSRLGAAIALDQAALIEVSVQIGVLGGLAAVRG